MVRDWESMGFHCVSLCVDAVALACISFFDFTYLYNPSSAVLLEWVGFHLRSRELYVW